MYYIHTTEYNCSLSLQYSRPFQNQRACMLSQRYTIDFNNFTNTSAQLSSAPLRYSKNQRQMVLKLDTALLNIEMSCAPDAR